ncbi:hypothetical protein SIN8267_01056 [Sinobacterium norvegicum]|uniref:Methyltransferase domain-containing protein n=1 Tax=Sinobacterium norvegicum TaxID=1641715 RepID=A0ABM9ADD0_9GAMM|nr:hypothetical protein [Sinobacterium norvegicum]CAH0990955.1 hypothetical protein SIN8267_01056 [Sinobacterium norvegicum]
MTNLEKIFAYLVRSKTQLNSISKAEFSTKSKESLYFLKKLKELFDDYESESSKKNNKTHESSSELTEILSESTFFERSLKKPLGYPGDYLMVKMIFDNEISEKSNFATLLNKFFLSSDTAEGHRNRIKIIQNIIFNTISGAKSDIRILSIGCGPAIEIFTALELLTPNKTVTIDLVDSNQETIDYLDTVISSLDAKNAIINTHRKSANNIIRGNFSNNGYDLCYCAGLLDYLDDRTSQLLLKSLEGKAKKGGKVIATNVSKANPIYYLMRNIADWDLIQRNKNHLQNLTSKHSTVYSDSTQTNSFIEIHNE